MVIDPNALVRIDGQLYKQVHYDHLMMPDDVVLDKRDGTYGVIDLVQSNGRVAVRDGFIVEINVAISNLIKLKLLGT